MTTPAPHLNDMQRYLVEEEAEKWHDGRLTRREFMRRVTLIVGGVAAAGPVLAALGCDPNSPLASTPEPATSLPSPTSTLSAPGSATPNPTAASSSASPYHVAENDPDVRSEMVDIPSSDSSVKLKGYMAQSAAARTGTGVGPLPPAGVLVIHENRGLTDHIKDVVRRVAKAGYIGLCVDLVSRQGGSDAHPDEAERTGILGQMPPEQVIADLSSGLDYLTKMQANTSPRLGVVGFCFGGGYTYRLATKRPDLQAAIAFYGPNPPLEDVPNIKAAVLCIYGAADARITGTAPQLEDALKKAGITYETKIYDGANHAFHNDTGANYNPAAAKDAWEKTLAWFGKYL